MPKKKDHFKEVAEKIWPMTKQELEKGIDNAKKMMVKGEKYLKSVSEKSINQTKKLSLSLRKEKLYYDLGKTVASMAATKFKSSKKISSLRKQIKDLDKEIKKIK